MDPVTSRGVWTFQTQLLTIKMRNFTEIEERIMEGEIKLHDLPEKSDTLSLLIRYRSLVIFLSRSSDEPERVHIYLLL